MKQKARLKAIQKAAKMTKPGFDVARLKPSEIIERIRVLLAKCPPSEYKDHILQRLKNWERMNP